MIAGLFWHIATSDMALAIVGVIFVAALAVAHLPFVKLLPSVAPYVLLAGLVSYLALADLALCIGYRVSDESAEMHRLKFELAWHQNELEQQKATAEDAERIAKEKSAEADELKARVSDYETTLAKQPIGACALDDADIGGLQSLRRPGKNHRADPPRLRGLGRFRAAP